MKLLINKFLNWFLIIFLSLTSTNSYVFAQNIDQFALPTGGQVVSGNIDINQPSVGRLDVNQTTQQGIVNWNTFNVGSSASVYFNQPTNKSTILNNVVSGKSIINGSIFSNGRLILVNPTGILMGPTSAVRAEGAILSTLNITNQNFLNNNLSFSTDKLSQLTASGKIDAQYVALISPEINNKGQIIAKASTALAAGDDVLLSITGSNKLTVKVKPSKLKSLAKNEGTIETKNGIVTIKADAAQSLVDETIKITDAKAQGLVSENGVIKLVSNTGSIEASEIKIDAGSKGEATISGKLDVNSSTGKGGEIEITGKELNLVSAKLSADGKEGGGKILIGGDWQGKGDLFQSTYTSIDKNSVLSASATESGAGGTIVAWSNIKDSNSVTSVYGTLIAKGIDGDGGQIETSGAVLNYNGIKVNTSSLTGNYGNWLLDPTNITIGSSEASTIVSNLGTSDVTQTADNTITVNNNIAYTGARNATLTFNATTLVLGANITSSNGSLSVDVNAALKLNTDVTVTTNSGSFDVSGAISPNTTSASGIIEFRNAGKYKFNNGSEQTATGSSTSLGNGSLTYSSGSFTWDTPDSVSSVKLLLVAGGGSGGIGTNVGGGGGGGAGGVVYDTARSVGDTVSITVGAGGAAQNQKAPGNNGEDSVFDDLTVKGGGGGGNWCDTGCTTSATPGTQNKSFNGKAGGSGGGAGGGFGNYAQSINPLTTSVSGTATFYGNKGGGTYSGNPYTGSGGGGAGSAGTRAGGNRSGHGGDGRSFDITGSAQYYAGGGGGSGGKNGSPRGNGGNSIGGQGSGGSSSPHATDGTAHTGSGGGGVQNHTGTGKGAGGSGVVIVSYSVNNNVSAGLTLNTGSGQVNLQSTVSDLTSLTVNTTNNSSVVTGVISGDTALTKAGSGKLTTSANNTYTGGTTVSAGTLFGGQASRSNDVFGTGSISVASGATLWVDRSDDGALTNALTLNGGTLRGTNGFGQYWDGNITLGAHSTIKAANNFYIDGVISGSSKNLTKTGNGTVILRGTNTYSGTTTVSAGTLNIGGSGSLGSGTYAGNISNSGTFTYASSTAQTLSGVISGSGALTKSGSSTLTLSGTNTYSGDTTISAGAITVSGLLGDGTYTGGISNVGTLTLSSSSAQTLSGAISGSGGITKSGSGNLTLSGSSNFTGAIALSNGTLIAGADNALGSSPTITASNTPTFKTTSGTTLPSISVTGDVILESSVKTTGAQTYNDNVTVKGTGFSLITSNNNITIGGNLAAYNISGILQLRYNGKYIFNGASEATASGSSTSIGNGSLTYSSSTFTWTKPSTVSSADLLIIAGGGGGGGSYVGGGGGAGGLIQKSSYSLSADTYAINIGAGGAGSPGHGGKGTNGGNTAFGGSLTAIGGGGGGACNCSAGGNRNGKNGGSGGGASFFSGTPGSGTSGQGNAGASTTGGRNRGGGGGGAGGAGGLVNGEGTNGGIGIQSSITGTAKWYAGGGGAGTDGATGNTYGGLLGGSGVGGAGGAARRNGNDAVANTGSGGGGGGGHASLSGGDGSAGIVVINYQQSEDADLKITSGTGAVTISGNVTNLDFLDMTNVGASSSTVSGVISGSTRVIKSGTGTLNFAGVNTYTGTTTVNAGKLKVSGSGKLGSGSYSANIINNGTFEYGSSATQTISSTISGTGGLTASGGALTLSGTNTYTGAVNINSGASLVAGSAKALGAPAPALTSTSTSDQFNVSDGVTLASLRINGSVRLNSGITTTGAQNYTGNVLVAAGSKASPVEFTTTNSNINFGGTLKGQGNAKNRSMTVNAGTGNVIYGDRVGYAFNLETVDPTNTADSFYKMTTTANTITLKGDVMTYEEQVYNGDVLIGSTGSNGTTRTVLSMDPKVIFNGKVDDTVKGKHSLIAKAVEIDRGVNSIPTVQFKSTVGSIKALKSYTGLTGFQATGARWGVIKAGTPFGTRTGVGQKMTGGVVNSATNEKAKMAAKTAARASKFKPINEFGPGPLNFKPFGGGNSFGLAKSVEIVYADNPKFGDLKARPVGNNFDIGKPLAKGSVEGNNPSGQGFFGRLFGSPKGNPTDFKPANMETAKDFNAPPKQFKDIKDLFKTFEGKPQKGEFFNPYKLGSKPKQRVENKPQAQNNKSLNNTNSNPDAIIEDEENN